MTSPNGPNVAPKHEPLPEVVRIQSGDVVADINPQGAFIETFQVGEGDAATDVFFPFTFIDGKPRGTHLCLPNFGPDATKTLPQHGFARNVQWQVLESDRANQARLVYQHVEGEYAGLVAELHIQVDQTEDDESTGEGGTLTVDLLLSNQGTSPMRVAPALHNYFALPEGVSAEEVEVLGKTYGREDLHSSITEDWPTDNEGYEEPLLVEFPEHRIIMQGTGMHKFTAWTNFEGPYICVEPSVAGASFNEAQGAAEEYLAPGIPRMYRVVIEAEMK